MINILMFRSSNNYSFYRVLGEIFVSDTLFFPAIGNPIADGRENDLAEQLDNSAGEGTHDALCQSPAEEVMADNEGENQIVHKLADSCGNIGSAGIDGEALVFPDGSAYVPVYEVIYDSGNEEGDRASEKHIPGSAEGVV